MKKTLNIFFVVLGIIFLIILVALGGLFLFNSEEEVAPAVFKTAVDVVTGTEMKGDGIDSNPALNESQETMLETVGIDPAELPTEISAEQEACFEAEFGAERVAEIKAGDTPTISEIFRGRDCL